MIDKTAVGKRISLIRKKLGYSQAELAEKLSVSTQAVSKWETGMTLPDIELLLNLSWMGNLSINAILEGDDYIPSEVQGFDRGLYLLNKYLKCPICSEKLNLNIKKKDSISYSCINSHQYDIIDGVVYFGTREIQGEQWSLSYKNYNDYLFEHRHPELSRYAEGDVYYKEVMWQEIQKIKPRTILDIACGTGNGIKYIIERINWPITIIMTDLSHRILKWNRTFFTEELKNPYVDVVYAACDCSNLPFADNSIDLVFSCFGFESMQDKMKAGLSEAYRILKPGKNAVFNISLIDDYNSENTQKWLKLNSSLKDSFVNPDTNINDKTQFLDICRQKGFIETKTKKIYGEMPAPETDVFPFENMVMRWMAMHVAISTK